VKKGRTTRGRAKGPFLEKKPPRGKKGEKNFRNGAQKEKGRIKRRKKGGTPKRSRTHAKQGRGKTLSWGTQVGIQGGERGGTFKIRAGKKGKGSKPEDCKAREILGEVGQRKRVQAKKKSQGGKADWQGFRLKNMGIKGRKKNTLK